MKAEELAQRYAAGERNFREVVIEKQYLGLLKVDLRGANLSRANLAGADLVTTDFRGANLSDANLEGANLEASVLDEADLRGVNLSGANLTNARFWKAKLSKATLIGAVSRRSLVSTIWLRRTVKGADERKPASSCLRSASVRSRTKIGFRITRQPYSRNSCSE